MPVWSFDRSEQIELRDRGTVWSARQHHDRQREDLPDRLRNRSDEAHWTVVNPADSLRFATTEAALGSVA